MLNRRFPTLNSVNFVPQAMANDFGVSASFIDTELSCEPLEDGVELIWVTCFFRLL